MKKMELTDETITLMKNKGLSRKEAEMYQTLRKDTSYKCNNIIDAILYGRKKRLLREGYESGAKMYYSMGYLDGIDCSALPKLIEEIPLSNSLIHLMGTMGVYFSYHSKMGGMYFGRNPLANGDEKLVKYSISEGSAIRNETSYDEELTKIIVEATDKIKKLLEV